MSNDLVVIDNAVVKSAYNLTLNEQRLIYALLMKVPKGEPIDPQTPLYITRDDFIALGTCPTHVARDIRQATRDLMKKSLFIETDCGEIEFNWLSEVLRYDRNAEQKLKEKYPNPEDYEKYMRALRICNLLDALPSHRDDDDIIARVKLSERTLPFLTDLKECFTKIMVDDVKDFTSVYSYRIYQLMMQFKNKRQVFIKLIELRRMLVLNNKYNATKDFRKRVIDTAVNEINEKSPYNVTYELTKTGRKFTHLELKFKLKKEEETVTHDRDKDTVEWVSGLSDKEKQVITIQVEQYIEKQGITDEGHKQNIINKATKERWGLDDHDKQQAENEKRKQQLEQERKREQAQKQKELKQEQQAQKELEECEKKFLSLSDQMQSIILDSIENGLEGSFKKAFAKERKENKRIYADVMYSAKFKEIMINL